MAAVADVDLVLDTLAGNSHVLRVPREASVLESKSLAATELGRPAELQRWLLDGNILQDDESLLSLKPSESTEPLSLLCVFLPRTFNINVKVVKFSPGCEAQTAAEVSVAVSPTMTIDTAKFEALATVAADLGFAPADILGSSRFIKGGLRMKDDDTIENYHVDPESTLHLIIPRVGMPSLQQRRDAKKRGEASSTVKHCLAAPISAENSDKTSSKDDCSSDASTDTGSTCSSRASTPHSSLPSSPVSASNSSSVTETALGGLPQKPCAPRVSAPRPQRARPASRQGSQSRSSPSSESLSPPGPPQSPAELGELRVTPCMRRQQRERALMTTRPPKPSCEASACASVEARSTKVIQSGQIRASSVSGVALAEPAPRRTSSACRAASIDRWHSAAWRC